MIKVDKYNGKVYGRLSIMGEPFKKDNDKCNRKYVLTRCECGTRKIIRLSHITCGDIQSCGCFRNEQNLARSITHGLGKHPLYGVWLNIRNRCYGLNNPAYPRYGGKGIKMCKEWKEDFKSFHDWCIANGWENGLQIDKDIKGGNIYSPKNCLIVTPKENARHTKRVKLSVVVANNIRRLYNTGDYTFQKLADLYNICTSSVNNVIHKKSWT